MNAQALGPATRYAWFLNAFCVFFINLQGNIVPFLQDEFGLSYRAVSLHSSAIAVGVILAGLFGDRLVGRLGRRLAVRVGTLVVVAGAVFLCLSPGPPWSIASCILIGASVNPAVAPALLADIHGERRTQAYAGQSIVAYAFGIAAPLLAGLFFWLGLGWRAPVAFGGAFGIGLILWFRHLPLPDGARAPTGIRRRLPAAFWAFWALLAATCALEFCVLLWAPAYLERVAGFSPVAAASVAAMFAVGVLAGRIGLGFVVGRLSGQAILLTALAMAFAGFLIYWGVAGRLGSVLGILVLGLGVAPLYPIVMSFGIGTAGEATDVAGARMTLAFGISLLLAPIALGALADEVGLATAHLALPGLIAASLVAFAAAALLRRRDADAG